MDIWKYGKVFSARREPLEIYKFKRGDWLHNLFQNEAENPWEFEFSWISIEYNFNEL